MLSHSLHGKTSINYLEDFLTNRNHIRFTYKLVDVSIAYFIPIRLKKNK